MADFLYNSVSMNKRVKKLSLAIYWHMHQPVYELEGTYLMPWVRLHAVKDYLDMVLILEKFPKLKLNFNIVPALLDSIIDYTENGYHDIHSELSVSEARELLNGGTIGGGMLPKLNNCIDAIEHGVSRVHILDGRIPHCLLLEIFTNKGIGTAILGDNSERFFTTNI